MAEIFRAWKIGEEGFEKQVVIKRLLSHLASNDDFRNMFLDEARLASQLTHPNIVHVYDLGKHVDPLSGDSNFFIAMEYVFGKNLAEIRNKSAEKKLALTTEYLVRILVGAAEALHYAHEKTGGSGQQLNIVHRDVSPQNILISYDGDVKLVDFGIAKALTKSQHTQAGVLKGKLAYMSPEQARGEAIDRRADIYSLGVVFWEFLTGKRLFSGDSEASVLRKVLDPKIPSPTSISSNLSSDLEILCMRCLAPNPKDRYPDALSLAMALESHLRDLTTMPGSYSIRDFMRLVFGPEMANESEQIQEELKAVREFVAIGAQPDAANIIEDNLKKTVVLPSDPTGGKQDQLIAKQGLWGNIPGKVFLLGGAGAAIVIFLFMFVFRTDPHTDSIPPEATSASISPSTETSIPKSSMVAETSADPVDGADSLEQRIATFVSENDYDGALEELASAENKGAWSVDVLKEVRAQIMTQKSESLLNDQPEQALQLLQDVVMHVPDYPEAYLQMGRALTRLSRQEEALQAYDQAILLDSSQHIAFYNHGTLLMQKGEYEKAEQSFLKTIALQPPYLADVLVNIAGCRAMSEDWDGAISYLRQAVKADPDHVIAKQNLERLMQ